MLILISPSKKLCDTPKQIPVPNQVPALLTKTHQLHKILKSKSAAKLEKLLNISPSLASLNWERYQDFSPSSQGYRAIMTFSGTVYEGLNAETLSLDDLKFANEYLRHLSGFYGILKPFDQIQPYRLDMGTRLKTPKGSSLYAFWGNQITDQINQDLRELNTQTVINLASHEYAKSIKPAQLDGRLITITFKESKNGTLKSIMTYAKFARGLMARFIIQNRIKTPQDIWQFTTDGYSFNRSLSSENEWFFTR